MGQRIAAFLLDLIIMVGLLLALTIAAGLDHRGHGLAGVEIARDRLAARLLPARNFYFILMEMGPRAATFGKRAAGLRVVARSGERLTADRVIARNMMREIEFYLPLSFLFYNGAEGAGDALTALAGLAWTCIFLFFPFFNKDRMRVGDLLAGTWVVNAPKRKLTVDLAARWDGGARLRLHRRPARRLRRVRAADARAGAARPAARGDRAASPRRSAARSAWPTTAAPTSPSSPLITMRPARGWSAACCSASAAPTSSTSRSRRRTASWLPSRRSAPPRRTAPDRPRRVATAAAFSSTCDGREAPTIAEATLGSRSTQASANWARLRPGFGGERLQPLAPPRAPAGCSQAPSSRPSPRWWRGCRRGGGAPGLYLPVSTPWRERRPDDLRNAVGGAERDHFLLRLAPEQRILRLAGDEAGDAGHVDRRRGSCRRAIRKSRYSAPCRSRPRGSAPASSPRAACRRRSGGIGRDRHGRS